MEKGKNVIGPNVERQKLKAAAYAPERTTVKCSSSNSKNSFSNSSIGSNNSSDSSDNNSSYSIVRTGSSTAAKRILAKVSKITEQKIQR